MSRIHLGLSCVEHEKHVKVLTSDLGLKSCEAGQHLCYMDSTIPLLSRSKISNISSSVLLQLGLCQTCLETVWFSHDAQFSHDAFHLEFAKKYYNHSHSFFFFSFFFYSVLRPFEDYFSSYETGQSVGGKKRENPEKNRLAHPQAEHSLSHVASVGSRLWVSNPHQTQR